MIGLAACLDLLRDRTFDCATGCSALHRNWVPSALPRNWFPSASPCINVGLGLWRGRSNDSSAMDLAGAFAGGSSAAVMFKNSMSMAGSKQR